LCSSLGIAALAASFAQPFVRGSEGPTPRTMLGHEMMADIHSRFLRMERLGTLS